MAVSTGSWISDGQYDKVNNLLVVLLLKTNGFLMKKPEK